MTTIPERRREQVAKTVQKIRDIENGEGVTPGSIAKIRDALIPLGRQKDLFPEDEFPLPQADPASGKPARNILYLLSVDEDGRFALYLSAENAGMKRTNKPHDHTAWAAIAGVTGNELNIIYERTDDGRTKGKGTVEPSHEIMVKSGTGVALTTTIGATGIAMLALGIIYMGIGATRRDSSRL